MDSSTSDEDVVDETNLMMMILEEMERVEGNVPNFKGSSVGHRVLNRRRTRGACCSLRGLLCLRCAIRTLFSGLDSGCSDHYFCASCKVSGPMMITSS